MERARALESRLHEIALLPPGAPALGREESVRLIAELQEAVLSLRTIRDALGRVMEAP